MERNRKVGLFRVAVVGRAAALSLSVSVSVSLSLDSLLATLLLQTLTDNKESCYWYIYKVSISSILAV